MSTTGLMIGEFRTVINKCTVSLFVDLQRYQIKRKCICKVNKKKEHQTFRMRGIGKRLFLVITTKMYINMH